MCCGETCLSLWKDEIAKYILKIFHYFKGIQKRVLKYWLLSVSGFLHFLLTLHACSKKGIHKKGMFVS